MPGGGVEGVDGCAVGACEAGGGTDEDGGKGEGRVPVVVRGEGRVGRAGRTGGGEERGAERVTEQARRRAEVAHEGGEGGEEEVRRHYARQAQHGAQVAWVAHSTPCEPRFNRL